MKTGIGKQLKTTAKNAKSLTCSGVVVRVLKTLNLLV
jgi:hypothetical protein